MRHASAFFAFYRGVAAGTLLLAVAFVLCLCAHALGAESMPADPASPAGELATAALAFVMAELPATWEGWITLAVTVCAAISAIWKRPAEDAPAPLRLLYALVNAAGLNAGRAKNASAVCRADGER